MYGPRVLLVLVGLLAQGESRCAPGSVKQRGVTPAQITEIVNMHNHYRTMIAQGKLIGRPKAGNMKKISWDNTLAAAAQKISDTCVFAHVKVNDIRWGVGQNLYQIQGSPFTHKVDWPAAVTDWFNEVYKTNYVYSIQRSDLSAGHYTQVINANTIKVGCGMVNYVSGTKNTKLLVCNYGPAGNYMGQYPYLKGTGCSNLC